MNHPFIYVLSILLLVGSCIRPTGNGSTIDDTLQTTIEQEIDAWCNRDSSILRAYCLCLKNGAILVEYRTNEKEKEGSMVIPGNILTPVFKAIATDRYLTDLPPESHSVNSSDLYGLISSIKTIFPDSDCLIPTNLSLPTELEKAMLLTLQGRCHRVSESDICAAYDCIANKGSSYAPFRDYGATKDKRIVCSNESATEVIRSIEYQPRHYLPTHCLVYSTTEENVLIAVFFSISKNPITTMLSITYNRDQTINNQPANEMLSFIDAINSIQ